MKRRIAIGTAALLVFAMLDGAPAEGYLTDTTIPTAGGCPALDR
jgi:hypothetical protein